MRQYEAQSSVTIQDTIKAAAILAHNPQDPEWRRHVGLNATRLQGYEALESEWKAMHEAYYSARKPIRTISGVLELISRFEFEFLRREIFFEGFEFLVCSNFNHTPCGCTCACVVACVRPQNSISNVVASVTIHDDMFFICIYL